MSVALACTACGPGKTTTTESEPTTTLETTSTATSDGTTTTTTPTSTETSPTSTTTGTPASCEAFLPDETTAEQTTITLTNASAGPLWLGAVGCSGLPDLDILDGDGQNHFFVFEPCSPAPCELLMAGECILGCDDCVVPAGLRLDPGASFSILWAGADVEFMEMTAECAPGPGCAGECVAARERPAGTYEITVSAAQQCVGTCDCASPSPNGHCTVDGGIILSEELTVSVPLMFPEMLEIEIPIGG
ncbi:hypothetical protein OV203_18295 [Nannocystis sp. ILAH1]|uniref:hypothetical protein n=1 Tax=Nannocystis sp. ILAH1 TaxID=2996789 RepID=UPI002271DBEE|nr:hypothetical protein [Nannocystis sp. ILAH1]MCY0989093.1 hypothetical protein [Nannocystis sp. ILAH1]